MENPAPVQTSITAPYGKACTGCAKARCKCILRQGIGKSCERCLRLKRECVPSVSMRRKGSKTATKSSAQLQKKLDDLMTLMKKQTADESTEDEIDANTDPTTAGPTTSELFSATPAAASAVHPPGSTVAASEVSGRDPTYAVHRIDHSQTSPYQQADEQYEYRVNTQASCTFPSGVPYYLPTLPSCPVEIGPEEAEQNLSVFRDQMLYYLPFVHIPPRMTARRLCQEKPFLWFSIMAITTHNVRDQIRMGSAIRRHLAQKMVVENQTSMDLLLGLLVFLGWSHFHRRERSHLSLITSLVVSLVYDLFLLKTPDETVGAPYSRDMATVNVPGRAYGPQSGPSASLPSKERTMEKRRALLTSFYHTSVISHTAKKIKPLEWTAVMDDDLEVLSKKPECSGDTVLAALVRIQLVVDQLGRLSWSPRESVSSTLYADSLRARIRTIETEMGPKLATHELLANALIEAELNVHETILLNTHASSPYSLSPDLTRHLRLQDTLATLSAGLDAFFAMSPCRYGGVTFALWDQVRHRFALLIHLAVHEYANWQAAVAGCHAAGLNLEAVGGRLAAAEEAFLRSGGGTADSSSDGGEDALFFRVRLFLESMRNCCAAGMAAAGMATSSGQAQVDATSVPSDAGPVTTAAAALGGSTAVPVSASQVDDMWLTDMFYVPWDWGTG